ncbi:MAG: NUDIX hydrolase [Candidatus Spechtbacterales bacterium]|nr:NUDIX hydrolase [Candidatus Spechtbacterales bacterium]
MSHASVVLVVDNDGDTVLVQDPKWDQDINKLPGGKSLPGESAAETAVRELEEETGLRVETSKLVPVNDEDRGNHHFYTMFTHIEGSLVEMKNKGLLKKIGDEGEIVKIFKLSDIYMMAEGHSSLRFLESHYLPERGGVKHKVEELICQMPQAV